MRLLKWSAVDGWQQWPTCFGHWMSLFNWCFCFQPTKGQRCFNAGSWSSQASWQTSNFRGGGAGVFGAHAQSKSNGTESRPFTFTISQKIWFKFSIKSMLKNPFNSFHRVNGTGQDYIHQCSSSYHWFFHFSIFRFWIYVRFTKQTSMSPATCFELPHIKALKHACNRITCAAKLNLESWGVFIFRCSPPIEPHPVFAFMLSCCNSWWVVCCFLNNLSFLGNWWACPWEQLCEEPRPKAKSESSAKRSGTTRASTHEKSHYFGDFFLTYYASGTVPTWRAVCPIHESCTKSMRTNQETSEDTVNIFWLPVRFADWCLFVCVRVGKWTSDQLNVV